jgi:glycosyltransferase involved in cell wall biosynthesis
MRMAISVVVTVRDERTSVEGLVDALLRQTRLPDEIVIVDGGSSDGTVEWLTEKAAGERRLRIHIEPGTTIAQGRNIAIARARGAVIAVTDAGTTPHPDWLERLVEPLEEDASVGVASGFFVADGRRFLERCISTIITPQLPEVDPEKFLPSSRSVAFRKEWWTRVGGYPEWLRHCEDLVFDMALRSCGAPMRFVPDALVTWNARPTLRAFAHQYFNYARGDGHALLWPYRQAARYSAYVLGLGLALGTVSSGLYGVILCLGLLVHLRKPLLRLIRRPIGGSLLEKTAGFVVMPVVVVVGDVAKIFGYAVGRFERWLAGGEQGLLARTRAAYSRRATSAARCT